MKYTSVFLCAVWIFIFASTGRGQDWEVQLETPDMVAMYDVEYVTDSVFVAAGFFGRIFRTEDGGTTWRTIESPVREDLHSIQFLNSGLGWAVGDSGTIIRSDDQGVNWHVQESGTNGRLYGISFTDELNGWVVGWDGVLLHTANGGENWEQIETDSLLFPSVNNLYDVDFFDAEHGWIAGETMLYTTDAGASWNTVPLFAWIDFLAVDALNDSTMVACGQGGAILRIEGAITEDTVFVDFVGSSTLVDLDFVDEERGFAIGSGNFILSTTDGGLSWTSNEIDWAQTNYALAFMNGQFGMIADHFGLRRTVDGGETWERLNGGFVPQYQSISFSDPLNGWCLVNNETLMHTADGGETWTSMAAPTFRPLWSILAATESEVWTVGFFGTVLRSLDNGEEWSDLDFPSSDFLYDIAVEEDNVWVVGSSETIMHSMDGGDSWVPQELGSAVWLYSVDFIDSVHGLAGGFDDSIFRTSDGGSTWLQSATSVCDSILDVDLITETLGFAVCAEGHILRTEDGGETWADIYYDPVIELTSVQFLDDTIGWVAGTWGTILQTTDGGDTWSLRDRVVTYELQDICVAPPYAWIAGERIVMRYSAVPSSVITPKATPASYAFYAYPNPFNTNTTLAFELPQAGQTTLQVFDITGRLLETLENRVLPAGAYSIQFEGDHLASGIYFVNLKGNTVSTTKKIVLLK